VRVTAAFNRVLALPGITVSDVFLGVGVVTVTVALRRRRLHCPRCDYLTRARHDSRPGASSWRSAGPRPLAGDGARRAAPAGVPDPRGAHCRVWPFARAGARFTGDVDDLVAVLASRTDKTTITTLTIHIHAGRATRASEPHGARPHANLLKRAFELQCCAYDTRKRYLRPAACDVSARWTTTVRRLEPPVSRIPIASVDVRGTADGGVFRDRRGKMTVTEGRLNWFNRANPSPKSS